ncbi:MAG TPA: rRNA maturation RNase YbeY [Opitutae bacterium]|nr:rRNA maturation RNase YbeY [Opitutae bacterium]|tara:strand:+ start:2113 stop:2589 length:477 start_codon:yes stop_codon:yes gene_type:complete
MPSCPKVESSNLYLGLSFSESTLHQFFDHVFSLHQHGKKGILSVAFLPKGQHAEIHGRFLRDFRPTDVITFPADEEEENAGEILVSVDQAIAESKERDLSFQEELSLYLIHGWLHLIGFDDREQEDRKIIRREEKRVMDSIGELQAWPDFLLARTPDQ